MTTFVALYRGVDLGDAQLIAASTDTAIVVAVAKQILAAGPQSQHKDPILDVLQQRRQEALRFVTMAASEMGEKSDED